MKKTIGQKLTELRGEVSATELSELSGVHRMTIWRIENDKMNPSIALLERLANALGKTLCDLLTQ